MKYARYPFALFLIVLLGCGGRRQQNNAKGMGKSVLIKVALTAPPQLPTLGSSVPWMQKRIETASGGSIRIKYYVPGKLVKPLQVLDAVSLGSVDAGHSAAGFWQGKMAAAPLFSAVPFGPESGEYLLVVTIGGAHTSW